MSLQYVTDARKALKVVWLETVDDAIATALNKGRKKRPRATNGAHERTPARRAAAGSRKR